MKRKSIILYLVMCLLELFPPLMQDGFASGHLSGPAISGHRKTGFFFKPPGAKINGSQEICQGDSAELEVALSGEKPWSLVISDGSNQLYFSDIQTSHFHFWVRPQVTSVYTIELVSDAKGVLNEGSGSAEVTVNLKTDVQIIHLKSSYNVEGSKVPLEATISGGIFSGPGVEGPPWYFDPSVAGTENSPHTIRYTYTNQKGCTSTDIAIVYVVRAAGEIVIPREVFCDYDDPFNVIASNSAEITGSFTLLNADGREVAGLTDHLDNTAVVYPGELGTGSYTIRFDYVQLGTILSLRKTFNLDIARQPVILMPDHTSYCMNEPAIWLKSDMPAAIFSGPGVSGNVAEGFILDPSKPNPGNMILVCTNTTDYGCSRSASKTLRIHEVPEPDFSVSQNCLAEEDTVFFSNLTPDKYPVAEWYWEFDDPVSGSANTNVQKAPFHVFTSPGIKHIRLSASTADGCTGTIEKTVALYRKPAGDFLIGNDCYVSGDSTAFISEMEPAGEIAAYTWNFYRMGDLMASVSGGPEISYLLNGSDEYTVELKATISGGCTGTFMKRIQLKPTVLLASEEYREDFEAGSGGWIPGTDSSQGNNQAEWNFGRFDQSANLPDLSQTWSLKTDGGDIDQRSFLYSPCFDFRGISRPMISLDVYNNLHRHTESSALQFSFDNHDWHTLGRSGDGINWYNSDSVAGSTSGWTGASADSTTKWVEARHDLDALADSSLVRFRIVYSGFHDSLPETAVAIDNILIGSRKRKVLLEYFTNTADTFCVRINREVNALEKHYPEDLIKLEYHTDFPGDDPFNMQDPSVPATRTLFYGIYDVPYSVLDGGGNGALFFDYRDETLSGRNVIDQSLKDPKLNLSLIVRKNNEGMTADVAITPLTYLGPAERILQVAVYEKQVDQVSTPAGEFRFMNVIRTFLPNAAGTAIFDEWLKGVTRTWHFNWDYQNIQDPEMIRVAAFVQDDHTREVYQAVTSEREVLTSTHKPANPDLFLMDFYPNPVNDRLYIRLNSGIPDGCRIDFYDHAGRMAKTLSAGKANHTLAVDVSELSEGIWLVCLRDPYQKILGYGKIAILR